MKMGRTTNKKGKSTRNVDCSRLDVSDISSSSFDNEDSENKVTQKHTKENRTNKRSNNNKKVGSATREVNESSKASASNEYKVIQKNHSKKSQTTTGTTINDKARNSGKAYIQNHANTNVNKMLKNNFIKENLFPDLKFVSWKIPVGLLQLAENTNP